MGPLTRYSHGETLTLLHQVPLGAIEVIILPGLNRIHARCCRWMFRDNFPSLFGFFLPPRTNCLCNWTDQTEQWLSKI